MLILEVKEWVIYELVIDIFGNVLDEYLLEILERLVVLVLLFFLSDNNSFFFF